MRRRPSKPQADGASSEATADSPIDAAAAARQRALRLLTRREHGAKELRRKLVWRGIAPAEADDAIEALKQAGWQSDARYVASVIRQRIGQGYGPLRIQAELEDAGVTQALVDEALAEAAPDWKALAMEAHGRRFDTAPAGGAEWQKQYRFLAGRGFESDQIYAVLKARPEADEFS